MCSECQAMGWGIDSLLGAGSLKTMGSISPSIPNLPIALQPEVGFTTASLFHSGLISHGSWHEAKKPKKPLRGNREVSREGSECRWYEGAGREYWYRKG